MRRYRFRDGWHVPAPRDRVHAVLADVEHYPEWWPQVVACARISDTSGIVVCRSDLPYSLELRLTELHREPGLLETRVDGDLVGRVRWRLEPTDGGTDLRFEQDVLVGTRALAMASYVGRPLLRWNHARMMRGCRTGLAARLGGPAGS
jgi:hypothetical protein